MAGLPDVVKDALGKSAAKVEPKKAPPPAPTKAATVAAGEATLIEVPLGELDTKFPLSRVDVHLDPERARKLRAILNGLKRDKRRLSNDFPVVSNADVMRWILDQIDGDAIQPSEEIRTAQ
jgi:hypothetical protein